MKKLLFLIAIFLVAYKANAQTEAGNFMIGGNVYFNTSKVNNSPSSKQTSFAIYPSAGYFISKNLAIGTGIGYSHNKYNINMAGGGTYSFSVIKEHQVYISPFARYYVDIAEQFKLFGQFSVPISFGKTTDDATAAATNGQTTHAYGVALAPGIAFFPSKRIGIEFSVNGIGYTHNSTKFPDNTDNTSSDQFSFDVNLFAPRLGIQFYF